MSARATTALVSVLIVVAIVPGVIAVSGLEWPYDPDGFRDLAIAQGIRDGRWWADPYYAGERAWYSPLVPGLVALGSAATGTSIPTTYVQVGPWLNILAPAAFFFFVRRLLGTSPAVFAIVAFLFLPGRPPGWAAATYSPWLFPSVTAQAFLYSTLLLWSRLMDRPTRSGTIVAGVLLGVTFLAHSGAAAFLAGVMLLTRPRLAVVAAGVAAAVISPFVLPLLVEYGLRVPNRAPGTWHYELATPLAVVLPSYRLSDFLYLALMIAGAVWVRRVAPPLARRVLAAWALSAGALFASALVAERVDWWPSLVPAYHFFLLLRALKWVLVGCGVAWIVAPLLVRYDPRYVPLAALVLAAVLYPRYLGREAHREARDLSLRVTESTLPALHNWIRQHTGPGAVFLASDEDALRVIGPAGRHAVSVPPPFASPFVDPARRGEARDRMFAALAAGDVVRFSELASQAGVTHILARGEIAAALVARPLPQLKTAFTVRDAVLFEVARPE